ncbi:MULTISPECIES: envelope stress response membrane protein PspB [Tatumella]|uniref:Phage shock protein B n=1 Tax=Tatumella ptyseos ATCC 33301 TaxID=1005995 RepID=A0A085JEH9_9GAMM|nr:MULTISPECIES: envelope stress response membrane protein PspB [Tatumella]KFD18875.1 phage shock protein B [Tatumella ptyseos ATCC 33301]
MSAVILFMVPLTIFVLFVAPVWLWLHYNKRGNELSSQEMERLQQATQDVRRMRERIDALEAILDAENPQWRQPQ